MVVGRRRGISYTPFIDFENCILKMQQNTIMEDPLPELIKTPSPPSKEFENAFAYLTLFKYKINFLHFP
jgi:hypothetical protein